MDDMREIYTEFIMEHNKSSKNKRSLDNANVIEKGHNPSCGDEIELNILLDDNIIKDISFTGVGCAISQASTSVMCDLLRGKTKQEAVKMAETFMGMIKKEIEDEEQLEILEDAVLFQNISNIPARIKCVVLAWHTLNSCI